MNPLLIQKTLARIAQTTGGQIANPSLLTAQLLGGACSPSLAQAAAEATMALSGLSDPGQNPELWNAILLQQMLSIAPAAGTLTGGGGSLPDQTGHAGHYLTTNGTAESWAAIDSDVIDAINAATIWPEIVYASDTVQAPLFALESNGETAALVADLTTSATLTITDGSGKVATREWVAAQSYAASGAVGGSGLTMSTARLLGRTTASTGAVEEIQIGSGLSLAAGTLTATGGGGSGGTKTIARFRPMDADFPASDFATLTTRNAISFLRFADQATNVAARFCSCVPEGANLASGFKIRIWFVSETATSGNARFGVRIERGSTNLDADSFDTAVEAHTATNGTSGILTCLEITTTNLDSLSAGEFFRLEVYRDCSDTTNDTVSGNVDVALVEVQTAA